MEEINSWEANSTQFHG